MLLAGLLVGEIFALLQSLLATLHRLDEVGFFFEIVRKNVLYQLIGLAGLLSASTSLRVRV
jgi:hypothetical protein